MHVVFWPGAVTATGTARTIPKACCCFTGLDCAWSSRPPTTCVVVGRRPWPRVRGPGRQDAATEKSWELRRACAAPPAALDWLRKTQGVWAQDFPFKASAVTSSLSRT